MIFSQIILTVENSCCPCVYTGNDAKLRKTDFIKTSRAKCKQDAPRYFHDTEECIGSFGGQCDVRSGQCLCKNNIEGRTCNQCVENMFNLTAGCTRKLQ